MADAPDEYTKEIKAKRFRIKNGSLHLTMILQPKQLPIFQDETIENLNNLSLFSKIIIAAPEPPSCTAEQIRKYASLKNYPRIQSIFLLINKIHTINRTYTFNNEATLLSDEQFNQLRELNKKSNNYSNVIR